MQTTSILTASEEGSHLHVLLCLTPNMLVCNMQGMRRMGSFFFMGLLLLSLAYQLTAQSTIHSGIPV